MFDRLRFTPVSAEELLDLRARIAAGELGLDTRPATLTLADLVTGTGTSAEFTSRRRTAFAEERERWAAAAALSAPDALRQLRQ